MVNSEQRIETVIELIKAKLTDKEQLLLIAALLGDRSAMCVDLQCNIIATKYAILAAHFVNIATLNTDDSSVNELFLSDTVNDRAFIAGYLG